MRRFLTLAVLAVAAVTSLSACAPATRGTLGSLPTRDEKPLSNYSYSAADSLMSRARGSVTAATPLLVATIGNVDSVETSSPLGRMISEQISSRLSQRGYNVSEMKLRSSINVTEGGEYILSRDPAAITAEHQAAAAVTGTYTRAGDHVLVNLRLIDLGSGRIVTSYDYTMPMTDDIRSLLNGAKTGWFGQSWAY